MEELETDTTTAIARNRGRRLRQPHAQPSSFLENREEAYIRENKHKTIDHSGLSCWRFHEDVASNPSHAVPVRSRSEACSRLVKVWEPGMTAIRGRCSRGSCRGSAGWTLSLEPKPLELCRT